MNQLPTKYIIKIDDSDSSVPQFYGRHDNGCEYFTNDIFYACFFDNAETAEVSKLAWMARNPSPSTKTMVLMKVVMREVF